MNDRIDHTTSFTVPDGFFRRSRSSSAVSGSVIEILAVRHRLTLLLGLIIILAAVTVAAW